jgi:helix-turn-helix protein
MSRLGRRPQGAGLVTPLEGSEHAKQRLKLFLQTLSGQCSVREACAELGICESRFHDQRAEWLRGSLELLEPRSPGRPPKPEPPLTPAEVESLRERVRELEARAAAVEVQAELASVLPHVIHRPSPGKKTTRRLPR